MLKSAQIDILKTYKILFTCVWVFYLYYNILNTVITDWLTDGISMHCLCAYWIIEILFHRHLLVLKNMPTCAASITKYDPLIGGKGKGNSWKKAVIIFTYFFLSIKLVKIETNKMYLNCIQMYQQYFKIVLYLHSHLAADYITHTHTHRGETT